MYCQKCNPIFSLSLIVFDLYNSDDCFGLIGQVCKKLKHLDNCHCLHIGQKSLQFVLSENSELEVIKMRRISPILEASLLHLSRMSNLRVLDISYSLMLGDDLFAKCLQTEHLEELAIAHCKNLADLTVMKLTHNIRKLDLTSTSISDISLQYISKNCRNLERLDLQDCSSLSEQNILNCCSSLPKLTKLDALMIDFKDAKTVEGLLHNCTNIKRLFVSESELTNLVARNLMESKNNDNSERKIDERSNVLRVLKLEKINSKSREVNE